MTLLGASGLVGGHVARALADDPSVARLALPVRRLPAAGGGTPAGPGVRWLLVDFERLEGHREALSCDQLLVCLGTTRRDAGSAAAFRRVDHDYVVSASRLAVEEGALDLQVLSAAGADASSRLLYSRVKGEMEDAVSRLPFRSVTVLRPSLLLGERRRPRPTEALGALAGRVLAPLLRGKLARFRPVEGEVVARAMARLAASPGAGVRIVESEEIQALGAA